MADDVKPLLWWWLGALIIIGGVLLFTYRSGPGERIVGVILVLAGAGILWLKRNSRRGG